MPYQPNKKNKPKDNKKPSRLSLAMFSIYCTYGRVDLTFEEVCEVLRMSIQTGYNKRANGEFPIPLRKRGKHLIADVQDVVEYLANSNGEYAYVPKGA